MDSGQTAEECTEHPIERAKSLRQGHRAEDCPHTAPAHRHDRETTAEEADRA